MLSFDSSNLSNDDSIKYRINIALNKWKTTRDILTSAVRSYADASVALRTVCDNSSHRATDLSKIESLILTVDSELDTLAAEESLLHRTRMSLAVMRNTSATLVRTNSLPTEIWRHIFKMLGPYYLCDANSHFRALNLTCTHWRQLILNTAELWTHVDIGTDVSADITRAVIQRSCGRRLYAHVCDSKSKFFHDAPSSPLDEVRQLVHTLAPCVDRMHTLNVELYSESEPFLKGVLDFWLQEGTVGVSRSLVATHPYGSSVISLSFQQNEDEDEEKDFLILPEHAENMLLSVRILHLQKVRVEWSCAIYRGLVDLRLDFSDSDDVIMISTSQLASILSSSPVLVSLKLDMLHVFSIDEQMPSTQVTLNRLEVLRLTMTSYSLWRFFPMIAPTSPIEIYLHIFERIGDFGSARGQLELFLGRSQMTTLYCVFHCSDWIIPDSGLLDSTSALLETFIEYICRIQDTLVLCDCAFFDPAAIASLLTARATPPICHTTIILLRCAVSFPALVEFIAKTGMRNLRLEECYLPEEHESGEDPLDFICDLLLEAYPEVRCTVSDIDSTAGLPCRTMFGNTDLDPEL